MFNKKRLNDLENKLLNSHNQLSELRQENDNLLRQVETLKQVAQRVVYLANLKSHIKGQWTIQKTKKQLDVLCHIHESANNIEIEVFNLTEEFYQTGRKLVLWAVERSDGLFIQDIQGGGCKGHGEVAMNHLFAIAETRKASRIYGDIKEGDFDHIDRLSAFYGKMGFDISVDHGLKSGKIEKLLRVSVW